MDTRRMRSEDREKLEICETSDSYASRTIVPQKIAFPRSNQKTSQANILAKLCTWLVDHQIGISLTLQSAVYLTYVLYPDLRHYTRKFFCISYYDASSGKYALGWDDIFFVFFWIVVFTGLRCIFMTYILSPLGKSLGLKKQKPRTRFAEQAWMAIYYACSCCVGLHIVYHSDYWLNLRMLWRGWPMREMDGLNKWYYLVQFAFWLQQIVVVNIEERRKDHWQMFTHHLITCALIFGSYGYHMTRVGTLFLCLMDPADLFLALAKSLKYLQYRTACDITFGVFLISWLVLRHVLYMMVCWSVWSQTEQEFQFGCYRGSTTNLSGTMPTPADWRHVIEPFFDPIGRVCFNNNVLYAFIALLLALQTLLLMWFVLIVRVAYKVIMGQGAEEPRSDDEDSEEEDEEVGEDENIGFTHEHEKSIGFPGARPGAALEVEVLSTDESFTATSPRTRNTTASRSPKVRPLRGQIDGQSSGVSLLAGSDRKELLGRIGCDKGSDQ